MKGTRILIAIVIAVAAGLTAATFVYRQMQQAKAAPTPVMSQVVLAAARIPLGTRLEASHLRTVPWPGSAPVPGMFSNPADCLGRALMTPVVENEPILENKLAPLNGGSGLPAVIPEGMRAVSVAVNDVVAVAGFVAPGTMVDVLATGAVEGGAGRQSITRTILENVPVLAAGQRVEQDKDGKPQTVPVITLLVSPEDANRLTMASTEGRIQLALRNTIDSKMENPPLVLRSSLFTPPAAPRVAGPMRPAAPKQAPAFVVEVIRGTKRESSVF